MTTHDRVVWKLLCVTHDVDNGEVVEWWEKSWQASGAPPLPASGGAPGGGSGGGDDDGGKDTQGSGDHDDGGPNTNGGSKVRKVTTHAE